MEVKKLVELLRKMKAETGSLICLGCGCEHSCAVHGCAILGEAADKLDKLAWAETWRDPKVELPPSNSKMVLVIASGEPLRNLALIRACELATYSETEGWILEMYPEWTGAEISAWMPLPALPKEGNNG